LQTFFVRIFKPQKTYEAITMSRVLPVTRIKKPNSEPLAKEGRSSVIIPDFKQTRASPIPTHVARDLFRPPPSHAAISFGDNVGINNNGTPTLIRPQARHSGFHTLTSSEDSPNKEQQQAISQNFEVMFRSSPVPKILYENKNFEEALDVQRKKIQALE